MDQIKATEELVSLAKRKIKNLSGIKRLHKYPRGCGELADGDVFYTYFRAYKELMNSSDLTEDEKSSLFEDADEYELTRLI